MTDLENAEASFTLVIDLPEEIAILRVSLDLRLDGLRLLRIAASRKRVSLVEFGDGRITLSVSEGTVSPQPRPLADAQGYPEIRPTKSSRRAKENNAS